MAELCLPRPTGSIFSAASHTQLSPVRSPASSFLLEPGHPAAGAFRRSKDVNWVATQSFAVTVNSRDLLDRFVRPLNADWHPRNFPELNLQGRRLFRFSRLTCRCNSSLPHHPKCHRSRQTSDVSGAILYLHILPSSGIYFFEFTTVNTKQDHSSTQGINRAIITCIPKQRLPHTLSHPNPTHFHQHHIPTFIHTPSRNLSISLQGFPSLPPPPWPPGPPTNA